MTRKDYVLIARIVRTITDVDERNRVADLFVDALYADNDRFDEKRFLEACDPAGWE